MLLCLFIKFILCFLLLYIQIFTPKTISKDVFPKEECVNI